MSDKDKVNTDIDGIETPADRALVRLLVLGIGVVFALYVGINVSNQSNCKEELMIERKKTDLWIDKYQNLQERVNMELPPILQWVDSTRRRIKNLDL